MYFTRLFISFIIIAVSISHAENKQKRISVLPFKGWKSNSNTEVKQYRAALTDKIMTRIVKTHRFIVVDRENLNKIIIEQKLQTTSGLVDQSTAIEVGRILGIDRFILGNFTRNSTEHHPAKYSEDGKRTKLSEAYYTSEIDVTIKLLDVETGAYLEADEAKGHGYGKNKSDALSDALDKVAINILMAFEEYFKIEASVTQIDKSNIYIDAGRNLGVDEGMSFSVYSIDKSESDNFTLGVSDKIIGQFKIISTEATTSRGKLFGDFTQVTVGKFVRESKVDLKVEARIMEKKINGKVLINAGSDLGLSVGSTLNVFGKSKEMVDPITGEVYGTESVNLGKVYIYEVGPGFSRGKIVSGRYKIKQGMRTMEAEDLLPQIGFSLGMGYTAVAAEDNGTAPQKYAIYYQLSSHMQNLFNNIIVNTNLNIFNGEDDNLNADRDFYGLSLDAIASKGFYIIPELLSISPGVGIGIGSCSQPIDNSVILDLQPDDEPESTSKSLSSKSLYVIGNILAMFSVGDFTLYSNMAYSTMAYNRWSYSYREEDDGDDETYETFKTTVVSGDSLDEVPYHSIKLSPSINIGVTYEF